MSDFASETAALNAKLDRINAILTALSDELPELVAEAQHLVSGLLAAAIAAGQSDADLASIRAAAAQLAAIELS